MVKRLTRIGWREQGLHVERIPEEELGRLGFVLHGRARELLPVLLGQRFFPPNSVVFDSALALDYFDERDAAPLAKLATRPVWYFGASTWLHYVLVDDDRWLVLHSQFASCVFLESTEQMLLWCLDMQLPGARMEVFTGERARELGVVDD